MVGHGCLTGWASQQSMPVWWGGLPGWVGQWIFRAKNFLDSEQMQNVGLM